MATSKIAPSNLTNLFLSSFEIFKKSWLNLIVIIFLVTCLIAASFLIFFLIYYLLIYYKVITLNNIFTSTSLGQIVVYLISFILAVLTQILIFNSLIHPEASLFTNFKAIKIYFWKFLCLTIIVNVLFLIFSLPIYVAIALFALNNFILGIIAFLLGLFLIFILASYLVFAPFIVIENKDYSCLTAIKKSYTLAKGNLPNISFKILILILILIILNSFSLFAISINIIGQILSTILLILMTLLAFTYLAALYQDFKSIKNV